MTPFRGKRKDAVASENRLVSVVQPFGYPARRALYAAANGGRLRRRTWNGCALNGAGAVLGKSITDKKAAAALFDVSPRLVADFINVWDRLPGSDEQCTALLREAILAVGLFPGLRAGSEEPVGTAGASGRDVEAVHEPATAG